MHSPVDALLHDPDFLRSILGQDPSGVMAAAAAQGFSIDERQAQKLAQAAAYRPPRPILRVKSPHPGLHLHPKDLHK